MVEFLTLSVVLNLYLVYRYFILNSHFRKTVRLLFMVVEGDVRINKTRDGWEIEERQA